jgi:hypothetical protein
MTARLVSDFPEPLAPISAWNSPGRTSRSMPSTSLASPCRMTRLRIVRRLSSPAGATDAPGRPKMLCDTGAGSIQSRSRSQHRLQRKMVPASARHGHSISNGYCSIVARASAIISPHDGAGGTTPSPRNESPASRITAAAMAMLICTSSGPATLGSTVRSMMRSGGAPATCMAVTKSRCRTLSAAPKLTRAKLGRNTSASTAISVPSPGPVRVITSSASSSGGKQSSTSIGRMVSVSANPRK